MGLDLLHRLSLLLGRAPIFLPLLILPLLTAYAQPCYLFIADSSSPFRAHNWAALPSMDRPGAALLYPR